MRRYILNGAETRSCCEDVDDDDDEDEDEDEDEKEDVEGGR